MHEEATAQPSTHDGSGENQISLRFTEMYLKFWQRSN